MRGFGVRKKSGEQKQRNRTAKNARTGSCKCTTSGRQERGRDLKGAMKGGEELHVKPFELCRIKLQFVVFPAGLSNHSDAETKVYSVEIVS